MGTATTYNQTTVLSARRMQTIATAISWLLVLIGAGYLWAWLSGRMTNPVIGTVTIKTNAALCLLVSGLALNSLIPEQRSWRRTWMGTALSVVLLAIGLLTLIENVTNWDLGIDQTLATESPGAAAITGPNRMGIPASLSFSLTGLSLLLISRERPRHISIAQVTALLISLIALLGTVGHLYGVEELYSIAGLTGVAWTTAASLLMLGLGLLLTRPQHGLMSAIVADDPGSANFRRFLPVLPLPILLGFLWLAGERSGMYDKASGTAMVMILFMIALTALAFTGARRITRWSGEINQATEELRKSEQRYRSFVEASAQVVWTTNPRGEVNFDIPAWQAYTGQTSEQARGFGWMNAIHPDDRDRVAAAWAKAFSCSGIYEVEYRLRLHDGTWRDILARGVPVFTADGHVQEYVGTCIDITERKRAEEALLQTVRELERSNSELEQFAYVCAHDLQEPLRQVEGYVGLLKARHADRLEGKAAQYFDYVIEGASRMSALVSGLLAYSRVRIVENKRESVSCRELLDAVLADFRSVVDETHARILVDALPTVSADPTRLTQLFQNLIGNALRYCRNGIPPEIQVGYRCDTVPPVIYVRDNGIGIDPQYHERVFQIFKRLHGREKYPGTGIGLAICRRIVEQHGGKIWIESETGQGSTFCFTLSGSHR